MRLMQRRRCLTLASLPENEASLSQLVACRLWILIYGLKSVATKAATAATVSTPLYATAVTVCNCSCIILSWLLWLVCAIKNTVITFFWIIDNRAGSMFEWSYVAKRDFLPKVRSPIYAVEHAVVLGKNTHKKKQYCRAVAAGQVIPVSTAPLFPSLVACLASSLGGHPRKPPPPPPPPPHTHTCTAHPF